MAASLVGIADFTVGSQGWKEKYFFKASVTDRGAANLLLQSIVYGRSAFFGLGVACTFARVSSTDSTHDGSACQLPYPIGPHPSWNAGGGLPGDTIGAPNDYDTVVQQRFETGVGQFWQRYYRCMPDSWVANKILQPGILQYWQPLAPGAPIASLLPTGGASHLNVCQSFWSYLIANTAYAKKVSNGNYNLADFAYIIFRQVTSKKIGRPSGTSRGRRPKTLVS